MAEENLKQEKKDDNENKKVLSNSKLCALLSYLLLGIVWYFVDEKMKKDEFAKFHVKQAIILIVVSFVGSLGLGVTFVLAWLIPLYQLAIFVLAIIGIYNAYSGEKKILPVIGKFSSKINI